MLDFKFSFLVYKKEKVFDISAYGVIGELFKTVDSFDFDFDFAFDFGLEDAVDFLVLRQESL